MVDLAQKPLVNAGQTAGLVTNRHFQRKMAEILTAALSQTASQPNGQPSTLKKLVKK